MFSGVQWGGLLSGLGCPVGWCSVMRGVQCGGLFSGGGLSIVWGFPNIMQDKCCGYSCRWGLVGHAKDTC